MDKQRQVVKMHTDTEREREVTGRRVLTLWKNKPDFLEDVWECENNAYKDRLARYTQIAIDVEGKREGDKWQQEEIGLLSEIKMVLYLSV